MQADAPNSNTFPPGADSPVDSTVDSPFDSPRRRSPTWGWAWELLAMVASVGSMAAVVAILVTMDNQPLTDWNFFLSIAATIAIFGMVAKSAAAFAIGGCVSQYKWIHFESKPRQLTDLDLIEEASRGPLGSLVLLARRPLGLASIAAVVTLLALGFETFVQQMVEFNPVDVAVNDGKAVLGLAHSYNGGARRSGGDGSINSLSESTIDTSMQGAVYRGLFNLGSTAVFNCSSKCEWNGTYISLGFASTCADVTDATLRLHPNASATWNNTQAGRRQDMNLTTPGGVKLDGSYSATAWQTVVSVGAISRINSSQYAASSSEIVPMYPDIARIAVLRIRLNVGQYSVNTTDMEIVECDIGLAAYSYSDLSSSGNGLTVGRTESFRLDPGTLTSTGSNIGDMLVFTQTGLPAMNVSVPDMTALQKLFTSNRFSGNIYDGISAHDTPSGMGDALRSGNISDSFQAMVTSMTDQLRSTTNVTAQGQSINQVVFVQVTWAWIILPLVVQLFSIVFLLLVLVQGGRIKALPLWKSSTTAVLTYDVRFKGDEDAVGGLGTGVRSKKELKNLGKTVKAKLDFDGDIPQMYTSQEDEKQAVRQEVTEVTEVTEVR
jgi:hypothetical protein